MEKKNAEQKKVDRSQNKTANYLIYKYLKKEDLVKLTDEEFAVLQTKLKLPESPIGSSSIYFFTEDSNVQGFQGDKTKLNVYKRAIAARQHYFDCFYRYSQVFGLCRTLNIVNIYDIGCGSKLQSLLLMGADEMNYTGIDSYIFHDVVDGFRAPPEYINELFQKFAGSDRIYYVQSEYPYNFTIEKNNIAILLYTMMTSDKNRIKKLADNLSHDFERVVLNIPFSEFNLTGMKAKDIVYNDVEIWKNPFEECYSMWKRTMPDYEFYKIGEPNIIFATKNSRDRKKLEKNYTIIKDKILTGIVNNSWYASLMNIT